MVSGAPGAGKTTLAVTLAASLSLPLFSMDLIKETLAETLGGPTADLGYSRRPRAAAMEVLWRLARHAPAAVIEANFRPRSEYDGPVGLGVVIRVDTTAPADVAALVARIEQALASSSTIATAPAARA